MMTDPEIFRIGALSVRWYGVCAAAGMLAWVHLLRRRAGKYGFKPDAIVDLTLVVVFLAMTGARLFYVIRFWDEEFASQPVMKIFQVYEGGLVFYGGFIGAVLGGIVYCLCRRWPLLPMGDLVAPALPLGHAFGRIGCLINGCCFGRPYDGWLSVQYPPSNTLVLYVQRQLGVISPDAQMSAPTLPIEGIAACCNLLLCGFLLCMERKNKFRGLLFPLYMMIYAVGRFLIEFGRGDTLEFTWGLTPGQMMCLYVFPVGAVWMAIGLLRQRRRAVVSGGRSDSCAKNVKK